MTTQEQFDASGLTAYGFGKQYRIGLDEVRRALQRGQTTSARIKAAFAAVGVTVELRPVSEHWRKVPMVGTKRAALVRAKLPVRA